MIPLDRIKSISEARGAQPAVCTESETLSWAEFGWQTEQLMRGLHHTFGAENLSTIAFISENRLETVLLGAAASSLKITLCGLDFSLPTEAMAKILDEIQPDCVFVSVACLAKYSIDPERIARGRPIVDLDGVLPNAVAYSNLMQVQNTALPTLKHKAFRAISFTSGTSGVPKAVIRTKSFDARRFAYFSARYGFSSHDSHLVTIPLYHAAGSGWARLFLQLGSKIVIAPHDATPRQTLALIREHTITTSIMTPPQLDRIVRQLKPDECPAHQLPLRFLMVGGKHFPVSLKIDALKVLGPVVYEYYGTTETGVNTVAEPADLMTHPASVGRVYDGNEICVLSDKNVPLKAGEVGRIAIASYMNMDCYLAREASPDWIEIGGAQYLRTPELGYLDNDGRLFLMNRSQGGSSINLYELENRLRKLPFIEDVALTPGKRARSAICGFTRATHTHMNEADIISQIRLELSRTKNRIEKISELSDIPYSPSGKVRVPELHKQIFAKTAPRVNASGFTYLAGIGMLTATTLAWGAMFPIAKNALASMDAVYLTLFRYGLASIVLMLILLAREGGSAFRTEGKALHLWLYGTLGFAGFSILAFLGLAHTRPEHGAIIMALMPLLTAIIQWIRNNTRPSNLTIGCIFAAFLGVLLVISKGSLSVLAGGAIWPILVILSGACCWVLYTLSAARAPDFSTLRYTALSAGFGALSIVSIAVVATAAGLISPPPQAVIVSVWPEIAYLVIIAGVMAVFSWNGGIKILGPVNGVLFINLVPITAFLIGWARGGTFTSVELAGTILTIGALTVNNLGLRGLFQFIPAWPRNPPATRASLMPAE